MLAIAGIMILALPSSPLEKAPTLAAESAVSRISFNNDIRPILSENCFHCHGPDTAAREADLSLHSREEALAVIEPGDPEASELVSRILDSEDPMPPIDSNRSLTSKQKELLRQWVTEGAEYQRHWAFVPPVKKEPPKLSNETEIRNPIDAFVQAQLAEEGLSAAATASPAVLARRASLALTGLQPTPARMQEYLAESDPAAYPRWVDQLLSSDAYAERMTLAWLDAARYADTDGYQNDGARSNWPWRDWVIAAYRKNMPFDQFTIEQLAGDMLPHPSHSQKLATAFNRNHRQNNEGGALAEEFFVENVIDRVETTSTVWLGLTAGCARCHDHKFDPISQRDFFQLFAYFNNIGEKGTGSGVTANPLLTSASPLHKIPKPLTKHHKAAEDALAKAKQGLPGRLSAWTRQGVDKEGVLPEDWRPIEAIDSASITTNTGTSDLSPRPDGSYEFDKYSSKRVAYRFDINTAGEMVTGIRIDALSSDRFSSPPRFSPSSNGNFVVTNVSVEVLYHEALKPQTIPIKRIFASYQQAGYAADAAIDNDANNTGWAVLGADPAKPISLLLQLENPLKKDPDAKISLVVEQNSQFADHTIGQARLYLTNSKSPIGPPAEVLKVLQTPADKRDGKQNKRLTAYYESIDPPLLSAKQLYQKATNAIKQAGYQRVPVMVMAEREKRTPTYLLNRGQYDDPDKSQELPRGIPAALLGDRQPPSDRLELARWLVGRDNPITARVVVNRMWQQMFGIGLVKTAEDFGSQGAPPSHPELLDWLAVELIDSGWDVQAMYRLILNSHTFRQDSRVTNALYEQDPENRLLARGPRFRLDGFAIRDVALHAAGLLNPKIGGPPVKPYQPKGLWNAVSPSVSDRYVPDKGEELFRKSLYTYWKRAVNPPRQTIFDASSREVCNVRQRVTNTPLQALALMNDITFIEAARHLGKRMILEGGETVKQRLAYGYQLATSYHPSSQTQSVLHENYLFFLQYFGEHTQEAEELLSHGTSKREHSLNSAEHAAYAATAHLLLNLDETISLE